MSRDGSRASVAAFVLLAAPSREDSPSSRLGVTASRRVGNAVVRNRIKRRIREWFRRNRGAVPGQRDLIVIARQGAANLDAASTWQQLHTAAERLRSHSGTNGRG